MPVVGDFFNILGNLGMMSVAKGRESQKTV